MDFDAILDNLTTGKINIGISSFTYSKERENNFNFSKPYYSLGNFDTLEKLNQVKLSSSTKWDDISRLCN